MRALNQVIQALRLLERQGAIPTVKDQLSLAQQIISLAKQQAKEEAQ